ncbi:armadillo-type protein [Dactylonectria macrodidyma]|uniref:Armadillo-type protein n=1 Tax=Dactylonectria macrodidyma TaxID=307937 RepID=A0A9P9FHW0_9HYPO|nr:armadillo-type protein [Dactylonectria macrodidyma]
MDSFDAPRRPRPKSTILESFMNRRQASDSDDQPARPLPGGYSFTSSHDDMAIGNFSINNPGALGELQQNQQEPAPRFPRQSRDDFRDDSRGRSRSPTKTPFGNLTVITSTSKDASKAAKSREASPKKPSKTKSGTNLAGLLRPKSLRNLHKLLSDEDIRSSKDKENRTPDEPVTTPPIFAQFTSDPLYHQPSRHASIDIDRKTSDPALYMNNNGPGFKERPKSFQVPIHSKTEPPPSPSKFRFPQEGMRKGSKDSSSSKTSGKSSSRSKALGAFAFSHGRSKSTTAGVSSETAETLNPEDVDRHLEAMLDRRNIPENQRYKMRNLNDTIKMEFIRQDWAEMAAVKNDRPGSMGSVNSTDGSAIAPGNAVEEKPKRTRGKSFTLSRGKKEPKEPNSPTKKSKGDGTLGRHFRSKSTESVVSDGPPGSSGSSSNSGLLAKIKLQQGPADYVAYLRKVQKPQLVEVGKIHKLRLLLRNETVAWIEEFIQHGGMKEIVSLLTRIMDVEWREEHEDALLHENLLCLKALVTTARAMQYLHSIQGELFPKLLHMLFDPEKKGPSEFTTRNIITSILFSYIESATPAERVFRAKSILAHLRDPEPKEDERPVPFVLEMRRDRPYRVWCKEAVSVTKEVFWIFLHNVNVVNLPLDKANPSSTKDPSFPADNRAYSYMLRHFPQERPPVPAAPYVGGVEWDATNYLASHLDLMNAILACAATKDERNKLRGDFKISGWERCLGGSLRLCKEKFYGSVHDGLRTWVAAAAEDGWDVKDVRYGPPPECRSPPKKAGGGQKIKVEPAPKLEMPKLDFGMDKPQAPKDDGWLE